MQAQNVNLLSINPIKWLRASPAKFLQNPYPQNLLKLLYSVSIIERSKFWKFQLNSSFSLDFMTFWIFQGMLNFSGYEDFFNFGKQFWEILKFTRSLKIFTKIYAQVTIGSSSEHTNMNFLLRVSKNQIKVKNLPKKSWILNFFWIYEVFLFANGLFKVLKCSNHDR